MTGLAAKRQHKVKAGIQGVSLKIKTYLEIKFIWLLILETIPKVSSRHQNQACSNR